MQDKREARLKNQKPLSQFVFYYYHYLNCLYFSVGRIDIQDGRSCEHRWWQWWAYRQFSGGRIHQNTTDRTSLSSSGSCWLLSARPPRECLQGLGLETWTFALVSSMHLLRSARVFGSAGRHVFSKPGKWYWLFEHNGRTYHGYVFLNVKINMLVFPKARTL